MKHGPVLCTHFCTSMKLKKEINVKFESEIICPVNLSVLPAKGVALLVSGAYCRHVVLVLGTGQVLRRC